MKPLRQLAFVLEDFALQTPAQQLLDRFLFGYRRNGGFHKLDGVRIEGLRLEVSETAEAGDAPPKSMP